MREKNSKKKLKKQTKQINIKVNKLNIAYRITQYNGACCKNINKI